MDPDQFETPAIDELDGDPDQLGIIQVQLLQAVEGFNTNNNPDSLDNRPDPPDVNYFHPLEDALHQVHRNRSPQNHLPQNQNDDITSQRRDLFGNLEFRQVFTMPPLGNVPDLAQFYREVLRHFTGLAERVRPEGIQSNGRIDEDSHLEFVVQVLRNPRGGGKRKINKVLDCEILNKKQRHLYMVHNKNNQLCFVISFAQLINPDLTDRQALERGRELQHLVGLSDHTPVAVSGVNKFEQIVKRKIVVFCRGSDVCAL
ncbi:hypothetical protein F2P81_004280 [Scophthalmus maximus]|uniref:Uncharacterized protein n=1 Tax=Scophthalmus maximus TaxID=52904 RepID=A0A6A4TAB1_SCOMX|nr:hypothetical protein F2P81_004280 [Scophthalmus maximus]